MRTDAFGRKAARLVAVGSALALSGGLVACGSDDEGGGGGSAGGCGGGTSPWA